MTTQDLIMKYAIGMHKRFTLKQKEMFIRVAAKEFSDMGYKVKANTGKHKRTRSINLMVGDVSHADTLVIANYDTPQHNFGNPMKYYPFNGVQTFVSKLSAYLCTDDYRQCIDAVDLDVSIARFGFSRGFMDVAVVAGDLYRLCHCDAGNDDGGCQ